MTPENTQHADRLRKAADILDQTFLGKSEVIRLMMIAAVAGEHLVLIGPPGTAKSALIRLFSRLIDAKYFEYLLTRFTEPNEIFGPIDITAFREGDYRRRMEGMLPEAEIVFLDEVFKANSAILNSLLSVLNERVYTVGSIRHKTPLISAFAASNEVPNDDGLSAVFDRFLLRVHSDNLASFQFGDLLDRGIAHELNKIRGMYDRLQPTLSAAHLHAIHSGFDQHMHFSENFLAQYKALVFQIRSEGISLSDRRAIKMLKLFAASAFVDGRHEPDPSDFFILRHVWNNLDQRALLDGLVEPITSAWYDSHPEAKRLGAVQVGYDALVAEINRIRELLVSGAELSDIQLFSQMKALGDIKAALEQIGGPHVDEAIARVDQLLSHVFQGSRFS